MLQATSKNERTEHKECAALQLARGTPSALPTTSETLVAEAGGHKTSNNLVSACSSLKNLLVAFGHMAACVSGFKCSLHGACVSIVDAVFPLWSDCPLLPVINRGPNPTMLLAKWQEHAHRARRITTCFRSSWVAFLTTSESLLQCSDRMSMSVICVCAQRTMKIVRCASAEVHVIDHETHATAIGLVNRVNFPMLLQLRVVRGSMNHPLWLQNM